LIKDIIIPENLKIIRIKFGKTQKDISKMLNLSVAQYAKKEKGIANFTLTEAKIISNYFQETIDNIFFNKLVYDLEIKH
jgi:DNA-binding XRE family transcriptional regulator